MRLGSPMHRRRKLLKAGGAQEVVTNFELLWAWQTRKSWGGTGPQSPPPPPPPPVPTPMQCDNYCSQAQSTCSDFRLHNTCSIIILWLHSLSDVIRSLLCNPRASSPAIINIRISVPLMQDTTRARARKYGKDAGLSPSSTHVRQ